jgi:Ran GTPase-activating protein (RanGAP) involved in mRNA processing and transport
MDSSDERFEKRTLRGKMMRALHDDTDDLRREAAALEFAFLDITGSSDDTQHATTSAEADDDEIVVPPVRQLSNDPFGTLKVHRKRNVRLLADMEESDTGMGASSSPRSTEEKKPKKKAPKKTTSTKALTASLPPAPSRESGEIHGAPAAGEELVDKRPLKTRPASEGAKKKRKSTKSSRRLEASPSKPALGHVKANLSQLELKEAQAKQRELEQKLAVLTSEKKAKEAELEIAMAKIKALQLGKHNISALEAEVRTARHIQQSIDSYQKEYVDIESLKRAVADELKSKNGGAFSSAESPESHGQSSTEDLEPNYDEDYSDIDDSSSPASESPETLPQPSEETLETIANLASAAKQERAKRNAERKALKSRSKSKIKSTTSSIPASSNGESPSKSSSSSKEVSNTTSSSAAPLIRSKSKSSLSKKSLKATESAIVEAPASQPLKKSSGPKAKAKRSQSQPPVAESQAVKHDGIIWFKTHYIASCQQNGVAAIEDILAILDRASAKKRQLQELDLNGYKLTTPDVIALAVAFQATLADIDKAGRSQVSQTFEPIALDLSHNEIGSGRAVVEMMQSITGVTALDVGFNNWGPKPTIEFATTLGSSCGLRTLKISSNMMGSKAGLALLRALERAKALEVLDLSSNALDDRVASQLAVVIQTCPLNTLCIRYNKFKADGVKKVVHAISNNTTLTDLDLTSCGIGERSKDLLEILEARDNITRLCIGFNKMPSAFVPRFTSFAAKQKNLVHLDLRGLDLSSKQMRQVIDAIAINSSATLQELVLNGNVLDAKCLELLIDYLTRTHMLHSLGLRGCGITRSPLIELLAAIKHSATLKAVDLSGNNLNDRRLLESMGALLQNNQSLTMIGLAATKLDAKTIGLIGQALQFNKVMEKVHIDGNKLGERGLLEFAAGMAGNEVLKVLSIRQTSCSPRALLNLLAAVTAKTQIEVVDAGDNNLPTGNKPFRDRVDQFDAVAVKF